jgi:arginine exporter protein ArgO
VTAAFLAGAAAGYGIAIPVGAIAVLILETALRRGFRLGAVAGAGAAVVDGFYAAVAAVFGAAVAAALSPWGRPLKALAVAVLVVIAVRGLVLVARDRRRERAGSPGATGMAKPRTRPGGDVIRTFLAFVGLTLLNPLTVVYFGALVLGLPVAGAGGADPAGKAAFVVGAFLASLSWQTLLAAFGALLHRRLPPGVAAAVGIAGNLVVLGFAAVIAAGLAG